MTHGTSFYIQKSQLRRWNLLREAYSTEAIPFDIRGMHSTWVDFVMDCLEEIDLLGYVGAYKTVDDMRRDYYGEED